MARKTEVDSVCLVRSFIKWKLKSDISTSWQYKEEWLMHAWWEALESESYIYKKLKNDDR